MSRFDVQADFDDPTPVQTEQVTTRERRLEDALRRVLQFHSSSVREESREMKNIARAALEPGRG